MANLVGERLGLYRVVAKLGRGGMAEVYKAYQPGLDRYVAVKVLHSHLVDDSGFIGRFEREAKAIGRLRHPNIVQALELGRAGETYYMAMEFIDGPTLKEELKERRAKKEPFTLQEIARVFIALCSAINYAHRAGMIHRDIKPANVMINKEEGQIVLTDFGIARIAGATQYTQTGALSGTPAYMSPEQGRGEHGDERSDIYALGIMLYEMVTGVVPYDADTPFAVIMKHIHEPLPLPSRINPDIPEAIEQVIIKAMSKEPDDRYQTAGEMAQALREAVGIAPGDTLQNVPLKAVASAPQVEQIDHSTFSITDQEKVATAAVTGGSPTVLSPGSGTQTAASGTAPTTGLPTLPILIGGGIIVILVLVAIAGAFAIGQRGSRAAAEATQTALAIAAATDTAQQGIAAVTETARAAISAALAPTQTAQAAATQSAGIAATGAAQATRDAELLGGFLSAQAATAEAVATAKTATAEAATTEALANITPPPTLVDTPTLAPPSDTPTPAPPTNTPLPAVPTDTPTPERAAISGKLAFPVDNGFGQYDVFIISLPDGNQLGKIQGARQPNFRNDGARLVINAQGGGFGEDVWEAHPDGSLERPVSGSPTDSYPTYNADGGRIAYSNPQLAIGSDGNYHSYIFVQCGIIPPAQEDDKCQNVAQFGILVPAGQIGEIQGSNSVWAANDHIFYKGCNSWAGGGSCGIFTVGSWGTKQFSNGETPRKVADGTSATPTDTKGNLVAYHSIESGNWEAYIMDLSGAGVVNISNSPGSNDGLPAISPDGQWVAFATDRDGEWAIYVAPSSGGQATKLLDFPKANPWGGGDRAWQNERISWGP